jgi:hypothetical protein
MHSERFWVTFDEWSADCHFEKQIDADCRESVDFKLLMGQQEHKVRSNFEWPSIEVAYLDPRRGRVFTARNRRDFRRRVRETLARWYELARVRREGRRPPPWLRERT